MLAQAVMSSCRHDDPACTALAVDKVTPLVARTRSSGRASLLGALSDSYSCMCDSKGYPSTPTHKQSLIKRHQDVNLFLSIANCLILHTTCLPFTDLKC